MAYDTITRIFRGPAVSVACYKCATEFAIPQELYNVRQQDGDTFWCPLGHPQHFLETTEQRLRGELAREKHWREQAQARADDLYQQKEHIERRRRGTLGALRKVQKRVKHGVCPCCNRTFQNLAAHMTTKHPTFAPAVE